MEIKYSNMPISTFFLTINNQANDDDALILCAASIADPKTPFN